jgi:hypothetical protein
LNLEHPAFAPYRPLALALQLGRGMAGLEALNACAERLAIVNGAGLPLRFVAPQGRLSARDYEADVLASGCVATRPDNLHDLLNALVWLRFPRFKAALNLRHVAAMREEAGPGRGRRRDALTVLDESGVWVLSAEAGLADALSKREWERLFWDRRDAVERAMRFIIVGHALLEKVLAPYPAMTGKCLLLAPVTLDAGAAEDTAVDALTRLESPRQLPPLPILGIPGWDDNASPAYYRNREIFRPLPVA